MKLSGCPSFGNKKIISKLGKWGIFGSIPSFRHGAPERAGGSGEGGCSRPTLRHMCEEEGCPEQERYIFALL